MKLWDIRKMQNWEKLPSIKRVHKQWDYRYQQCPTRYARRIDPNDMSLMTYTGHRVLRTLIRCYFSPSSSTGQQYVYTGSQDGAVYSMYI